MAKPAKKTTSKSVAKTSASSSKSKTKTSLASKKAAAKKPTKSAKSKPTAKPAKVKPAAKVVKKAKPVRKPAAKSSPKATKPSPKPTKPTRPIKKSPVPVKAKAKTATKSVKAPSPKPVAKGKAAAAKPVVKQLVKKKAAQPSKADKPISIRATRGATPAKSPAKRVVPREIPMIPVVFPSKNPHSKTFINLSHQRLLHLKDELVDSMSGMASETLRSRAQDSEASAFGMHQADAGSDAYDRDFTLSLLSQEQDALYEIEEALKRIGKGTYGICELSGKTIPVERLEVRPYARYTVEMQEIVDREHGPNSLRRGIRSLFGLGTDDEDEDGDEDSVEEEKN